MCDSTPIPDHLARLDWYAPHLAWLTAIGIVPHHAVPEGTVPRRAHLPRDADLRDANLRDADLRDADLSDADLRDADLRGADLRFADLRNVNLRGAVGISSEEEEEAVVAAAIEAIVADLDHWNQLVWHGPGYDAAYAPAVGACNTSHCLAGWMQAQLPLGDPRRCEHPEALGWRLAPRRAAAGWFMAGTHPDLQAAVDAAVARRVGVSDHRVVGGAV